jgi:endonuclease/exonuclease/phosphatase family protein
MRFWIEYLKDAEQGAVAPGAQSDAAQGVAGQGAGGQRSAGRDRLPLTGVMQDGAEPGGVAADGAGQRRLTLESATRDGATWETEAAGRMTGSAVAQDNTAADRAAQENAAQNRARDMAGGAGVPFVLMGDSNVDAKRGAGYRSVMAELLRDPALQDVVPMGVRGSATVDWGKAGPMRVDYVLPSARWRVLGSGVDWSEGGDSRHGLVWVDLAH